MEEAGGLDPGEWRVRSSVLWCNTYRAAFVSVPAGTDLVQEVDMESLLETVSWAWSPAWGWEFRAQVQGWENGGGIMDAFLSWFHTSLGVENQGRNLVAENQYHDYIQGVLDDRDPGSGLTQASFGVRGFSGPWSWNSWVKVPVPGHTGWGWADQSGGGTGLGWGDRWPLGLWGLTLKAGVSGSLVWIGQDPSFPGQTSEFTGQGGLYVITELTGGSRILVQGIYTAVPRSGSGYLVQGAGLLTMGFQVPGGRNWLFEGACTEEFLTWATMEVGFQAGLTWKL